LLRVEELEFFFRRVEMRRMTSEEARASKLRVMGRKGRRRRPVAITFPTDSQERQLLALGLLGWRR